MKTKRILLWAVLLTLVMALPSWAKPVRHKLQNGLTVITQENHEAPVVSFQVWVRAGAAFERPNEYGITHLIEHMIFKGSPQDPKGEMAGKIEALGGQVNAYTTLDHTNYHATCASRFAPQVLNLLADAVVNANFDEKELAREKEVVIEEIRMNQDDPRRRRFKEALYQSFGDHPYGRPVLGTVESVKAISRQDILNYRARWYRTSNVVVVAVGDFKTKEIMPHIEKVFAHMPKGKAPAFELPAINIPQNVRLKVMKEKVRQASVILTWPVAGMPSPKVFPLDMTASVLGEGQTSRLYKNVKEKLGLVDGVSSFAYTLEKQGLFMVMASMSPDKVQKAIPALLKETFSLQANSPNAEELSTANVNLSASYIRRRQTMQGQANDLGYFEMFWGGFEKSKTYLDRFKQVTAEDVSKTAQEYFGQKGLLVLIQTPDDKNLPNEKQLAQMVQKTKNEIVKAEDLSDKAVKKVLKNGLTVIVKPRRAVPLVSFTLATKGGQALENKKNQGLYTLWANTLTRGTQNYSYAELTQQLESMAASLSAYSGKTTCGLSGSFLASDWARGLEFLAEVWERPVFAPKEVAKAKAEQAAGLRSQLDSPVGRTFLAFRETFYQDHPYGLNSLGSVTSLKALTSQDLKNAHKAINGLKGAVLTCVGDVEPDAVLAKVSRVLGKYEGKAAELGLKAPKPIAKSRFKNLEEAKAKQTQIVLGFAAPPAKDPKRFAMEVLDAILGGMGGRLFMDLRDKQSLAYTVQPFYSDNLKAGVFGVYMAVGKGKEKQALNGLRKELSRIAAQKPSQAEIDRAKAYILGNRDIGLQTNGALAQTMASYELLGLGYDYYEKVPQAIEAVDSEEVRQLAEKYLNFDKVVQVTSGESTKK